MLPQPNGTPTLADFLDAVGYVAAIISVHRIGQIRDQNGDKTTIIDALILTAGVSTLLWVGAIVPYLENTDLALSGRVLGVTLATFSIWLAFAAVRLSIGPGIKTPTSRLLSTAAIFAMTAEIATTASKEASVANSVLISGSLALIFLGVAALHPTMHRMTEAPAFTVIRLTRRRLFLMTLAVVIAPIGVVTQIALQVHGLLAYAGLILCWVVVMGLVMLRLGGLVRAQRTNCDG